MLHGKRLLCGTMLRHLLLCLGRTLFSAREMLEVRRIRKTGIAGVSYVLVVWFVTGVVPRGISHTVAQQL